jgi:ABC-type antimicrobial peptide transport system permease subunit
VEVVGTEVAATEVFMGVEFTPDAASVLTVEVIAVAIVTSIEVAAMATATTDVMAIIMDTVVVIPALQLGSVF